MLDPKIFLPQTKEVIPYSNFVSGGTSQIKLELPGYYCQLLMKLLLRVTAGSSVSPDSLWMAKLLKAIKIKADNSDPFLDLPADYGGLELWYRNWLRSEGSMTTPSLPTASVSDLDIEYQLPIHFGRQFNEDYDSSEVISTQELSNLVFELIWGTNSDLGTGFTIDADNSRVELDISYILLQPGVSEQKAFAPKGWYPGQRGANGRLITPAYWLPGSKEVKFSSITAAGELRKDFLNGYFIKDVMLMVFDSTPTLVNNIIDKIEIQTKYGHTHWERKWDRLREDNMRLFHLGTILAGVAYINLSEIFNAGPAGIRISDADALQWVFDITNVSVASPGQIVLVYWTHAPTKARPDIVGKRPAQEAIAY